MLHSAIPDKKPLEHDRDMKYYFVSVRTLADAPCQITIPAKTPEAARRDCGVDRKYIDKVGPDLLGQYNVKRQFNKPMSYGKQANLLGSIAMGLSRQDGTPTDIFREILSVDPDTIHYLYAVKGCVTVTEYLRKINIDPEAITLAQVAEKNGQHYEALSDAAELLRTKAKARSQIIGPTVRAVLYITMSAASICGFGLMGYRMIEMFSANRFELEFNEISWILYGFGFAVLHGWPLILSLICAGYVFRKSVARMVKNWPVIRKFYELRDTSRAAVFAVTFVRLIGIYSAENIVNMLRKSADEDSANIYNGMLRKIRSGTDIAGSFNYRDWPVELMIAFKGIEKSKNADVIQMLARLQPSLADKSDAAAKSIDSLLMVISLSLVSATIIMVVIGVYLPIASFDGG